MGPPAELERELERLREELATLRRQQPGRDVDSVTEQIALQQEADTLRRALREKERVVEATAAQCRRLEDALEDQHIAYDGLKQDLERKKLSLAAAREQELTLRKEREDVEERYQALLTVGLGRAPASDAPPGAPPRVKAVLAFFDRRFLAGLLAGTLLVLLPAWLLRSDLLPFGSAPPGESVSPSAAQSGRASPPEPAAEGPRAADPGDGAARPEVVRTVRDPLPGGGSAPLMLELEGGSFEMGKRRALPNDDAGPAHEVTVPGFLIGASEVTFEEYDRFVRATARRFPNDFGWGRGRRPVLDVSWYDARAYADWLSRRTGKAYRLPTEAEWEYAASAGRRSPFWWGYGLEKGRAVCFDCGTMWDNISTAPVGTFEPNPLGLYDTTGNAMEWVQDCYHPNYIGAPLDGSARDDGSCSMRVARGGAFNKPARSMYSTARQRFAAETRLNMLGFRLARDR
jgi:formylglycine-generating enzyme required for sulfatase activity